MEKSEGKKEKNFRYVVYFCGCRLDNVSVFPPICVIHKKGVKVTGLYYPVGESKQIDPRHIC